MRHRALLVGLFALAATSCSSGAGEADGGAPITAGPQPETTAPAPSDSPTTAAAEDDRPSMEVLLQGNGITVVDAEPLAATAPGPLVLTSIQAERLANGGVMLGRELDALAPLPEGSPPMSYVLAAWVTTGSSAGAQQAHAVIGDADWHRAPDLAFPAAVVAAFVADLASMVDAELPAEDEATTNDFRLLSARVVDAPCSTVTNFIADVLDTLFGALRITPKPSADPSLFDFVTSSLAGLWNSALDLARGLVQGLVDTITRPVFDAIRLGLGALGAATTVFSYFQQQELSVVLAPPDGYRFAVGDEPGITGTFIGKGKDLSGDWPAAVKDCAKATDAPLPELIAPGAPVTWTVDQSGSTVITPGTLTTTVKSDRTAELTFTTGRETNEDATGESVTEPAVAIVAIERSEVHDFLQLATSQVKGALAQLVSRAPAAVRDVAVGVYSQVIDTSVSSLESAVNGELSVFSLRGTATVDVLHHRPPDTTTSSSTTAPDDTTENVDDFCAQYRDMARFALEDEGSDLAAWAAEIVRRLEAMRPAAPAEFVDEVDAELAVYQVVATTGDVFALADSTGGLAQAAFTLGSACGLG